MNENPNIRIYCLSHLTWNMKLFQRPQQFMLGLSRNHKVDFFCQIPTKEFLNSKLQLLQGFKTLHINENLSVNYFPYIPGTDKSPKGMKLNRKIYTKMVRRFIKKQSISEHILWLYHPKDFNVLDDLKYKLLVYDCMDDFKEFLGAPDDLKILEEELLKSADIVFTGGKHMHENKACIAKECFFLPCGVEFDHFAKSKTEKPEKLKTIEGPIAGYFGAIDERLDFDLLLHLVEKCSNVNFVFAGPVLKIDYSTLFDKPNVHNVGEVDYSELPDYGAWMDVCLIPFALTDLTKTMNPTKTLEYFALGKPVITTALPDVVEIFGDLVYVAKTHEDFANHLSKALEGEDASKIEKRSKAARDNSWKSAVKFIEEKIEVKLQEKKGS